MKPVVIELDLDFTMVNVFPGWERMCGRWAMATGKSVDDVIGLGRGLWTTDGQLYSPEAHLEFLPAPSNDHLADVASALSQFYQWLADGNAVYEDVPDFIAWADACEAINGTGIISFGEPEFQSRKINSLPAPRAKFEPITFTSRHGRKARRLVSLHGRSRPVIFVDDNGGEHEKAKGFPNIRRVQILRDPDKELSGHAQWHIRSLMEIPDLIPEMLAS